MDGAACRKWTLGALGLCAPRSGLCALDARLVLNSLGSLESPRRPPCWPQTVFAATLGVPVQLQRVAEIKAKEFRKRRSNHSSAPRCGCGKASSCPGEPSRALRGGLSLGRPLLPRSPWRARSRLRGSRAAAAGKALSRLSAPAFRGPSDFNSFFPLRLFDLFSQDLSNF